MLPSGSVVAFAIRVVDREVCGNVRAEDPSTKCLCVPKANTLKRGAWYLVNTLKSKWPYLDNVALRIFICD